jgi:hypothetical protein
MILTRLRVIVSATRRQTGAVFQPARLSCSDSEAEHISRPRCRTNMIINLFQFNSTWSDAWHNLTLLERAFLLVLSVLCIYAIYSLIAILLRLRALSKYGAAKNHVSLQRSLFLLDHRLANLREMTGVAFCLFFLVFFLAAQASYRTIDNSKVPVGYLILENMWTCFLFGGVVSFALLVLHLAQWFTSARVRSVAFRLNPDSAD